MDPADAIDVIDTRLAGDEGITAAYLLHGERPTLVDVGAQTSATVVEEALRSRGLGPSDLALVVLTHIHLDHCGAVGDLLRAFPRARVGVHPRGARHLVHPDRLVEATAAIYGSLAPMIGGMTPVDQARVVPLADGDGMDVSPGRTLRVIHTPGHANHHLSLIDEATGLVLAGDALGIRLPGAGLYPAIPPPQFDLDAARRSLARLRTRRPTGVLLSHYGSAGDPGRALDDAERTQSLMAGAARRAWRASGTVAGVARAIDRLLPPERVVEDPAAIAHLRRLRWFDNNHTGAAEWARAMEAAA